MDEIRYFERPKQVKFYNADTEMWLGGIAYQDVIICGCCGATFDINEIYADGRPDDEDPIQIYDFWVDINDEIVGD